METTITREYNYSDIYLIPNKCIVESRSDCDTSVTFGGRSFATPVVAANMKSVVNEKTCEYLAKNGWFYIMHRFGISLCNFYEYMQGVGCFTSGSIGVNEDTYTQLKELKGRGWQYDYLCLDVAHADSPKTERMVKYVKDNFPKTFLIVGNIATAESIHNVEAWGCDAEKVGISGGKVCETSLACGFGRPQYTADLECCNAARNPIISDGAASCVGDICKSFVAGATMKMVGSMMSGYEQSAGEIILSETGHMKKEYFGSASAFNKGEHKYIEGKRILVDYKGSMDLLLYDIKAGIASGISYAGGNDLTAFLRVKTAFSTLRHW